MVEKDNPIKTKSYAFAIQIVKLRQYLNSEKKEFDISKQVLRSGTSYVYRSKYLGRVCRSKQERLYSKTIHCP